MSLPAADASRRLVGWITLGSVLVLAAAVALVWYGVRQHKSAEQQAVAALTSYLEQVQRGDYTTAYEHLCDDVRGVSQPDFERFLRDQPPFQSFQIEESTRLTGMDGTYERFPVRFTYRDGTTGVVSFAVGVQTDQPEVCDGTGWRR